MCQINASHRAAKWVIRPTGSDRSGAFYVRLGGKYDYYFVSLVDADDMAEVWHVAKQQPDGSYAQPYRIVIPAGGGLRRPVCNCPGWQRDHKCRHSLALPKLLAALNQ